MEDHKFKPCLALVNKEKQLTQRALENFESQNRDLMVQTLMQSTSRDMGQSFRTLIGDESVQNLHENKNFIGSPRGSGFPLIKESKETIIEQTAEEAAQSRKQLYKSIKGQ